MVILKLKFKLHIRSQLFPFLKDKVQVTYMVSIIPIYGDLKAKVQVTFMESIIPIYGDLKAKVQVTHME